MRTKGAMAIIAGTIACISIATVTSAEDASILSGDMVNAMVSGKRLTGQRAGEDLRMRFAADGKLSIQAGHAVETGTWSVQGDRLCLKVAKWGYDGCGVVRGSREQAVVHTSDGAELVALGN